MSGNTINRAVSTVLLIVFLGGQEQLLAQGAAALPAPATLSVPLLPGSGSETQPGKAVSAEAGAPQALPQAVPQQALPPETTLVAAESATPKDSVSALIDPNEGGNLSIGEVSLSVPPHAVALPTRITIRRLGSVDALDEGMSNVTAGAVGYRFEPHGILFERPVSVSMRFDPGLLASETALSNLYTYFYDDRHSRWERLERVSIDRAAATITSLTGHFTDMINATLKLPEGPQPIQYDVNSIKNLEAADPGSGLPSLQGLEPSSFGSASFSIPLRLPPGRRGMTPQLALRYSSDASGGWLGRGFDIDVPAITIDTRFGMPRYTGSDRYSLEGEELLFTNTRDSDGSYRYVPRVQKAFQRIRWYRAADASHEDYWEVTDKDGTVREYGRGLPTDAGGAWIGPDRDSGGGDRRRSFAWYLSSVRDSFGNTITYDYSYDAADHYCYLADIRYTGHHGGGAEDAGAFTVRFNLDPSDKPDARIDARGGFISRAAKRLASIDILYHDALVRSYTFQYRDTATEEVGVTQLASYSEKAADGSVFYSYGFDYYSLPTKSDDSGTGYEAFGASPVNWSMDGGSPFEGLYENRSSSLGANFTVGVSLWIWIPFFGTKKLASFSVSAGATSGSSATAGTLIDVNGDGLPDLVMHRNGSLTVYLNTGSDFSPSATSFPGVNRALDRESQSSFSFGASASIVMASGGITWQESTTDTRSAFTDVNGDGFVDFVTAGFADSTAFALNTGTGFTSETWGSPPGGLASADSSGASSTDTYER
ncbi:MAG TPA: SpvB/TcaC N-terminal domain-containing protein, partial [Rectinemataceae bacterium]|nr:SpvB/TcaC N-terminal domain-containing protein [Rectinemataceae bacterium]